MLTQVTQPCIWLQRMGIQVRLYSDLTIRARFLTCGIEAIKLLVSLTIRPPTKDQVSGLLPNYSVLINVPNGRGNTPLHWAALNGHLEAVKVLVDAGADLLAKNNAGHDVVYEAEVAGKEEVVNWLLGAQKDDSTLEKEEEEEEGEAEAEDVEMKDGVIQDGNGSAG